MSRTILYVLFLTFGRSIAAGPGGPSGADARKLNRPSRTVLSKKQEAPSGAGCNRVAMGGNLGFHGSGLVVVGRHACQGLPKLFWCPGRVEDGGLEEEFIYQCLDLSKYQ